jgi:hypothetical protein
LKALVIATVAVVIVVATLIFSRSEPQPLPADSIPDIRATSVAILQDCEDRKRAFVGQVDAIMRDRKPPAGMFVSGGNFDPIAGYVVIEGNGLQAQLLFNRAMQATHFVTCTR